MVRAEGHSMGRGRLILASAALVVTAATVATATPAAAPATAPTAASVALPAGHAAHARLHGIPRGAPPAAYRHEPRLPKAHGWPFSNSAFPRTSGTGREARGALFWSDFVDDAYGAAGTQQTPISALAPQRGGYLYASKKAHNDGADIFRAAVGLTRRATYWRIDWNTLADKRLPIAEWTFDTDQSTATGAKAWPAGAGVRSPGIDKAMVVSSRGARIIDTRTGHRIATLPTRVSMRARSFVVRVPRRVLPVRGIWRVRLAAGIANAKGTGFAPVPAADGALPGQPAVYNVTFRSVNQEPPVYVPPGDPGGSGNGLARGAKYGNFWMDGHQADALSRNDVSAFSLPVDWKQLAAHRTTPQPRPTGYSVRWYVTPLHLGQGIIPNPVSQADGDLRPNYLSRIQPYAVYVPTDYDPSRPTPLTWILHSLSVNYNQYGGYDPAQIRQECEDRRSICATTEGFGPDGWYFDEAEVDFWDVWHQLAKTYHLDPNRTDITGYSMGGYASYKLGLSYPDLFAKSMPLAGPPGCGLRLAQGAGGPAGPGHCTTDGDTTPLVRNARWVPYVLGDGVADELVPVSSVLQQVKAFTDRGYRIHFELYPAEDHLVFATQDGFSSEIAQLGVTRRVHNPGHITYAWYPSLTNHRWGIGPTGVYWVRGLHARNRAAGRLARIDVRDGMRPRRTISTLQRRHVNVPGDPSPAVVTDEKWRRGHTPARRHRMSLRLGDVRRIGVDTRRARFRHGRLVVHSDGRARVRLLHVSPGAWVTAHGHVVRRAAGRRLTVPVRKGTTKLRLHR